ncbi:Bug family tripartite tricarboxylate transporter substrate binding protein [Humitalea sp. 24SJ18S-53]|uniref:Bug family tripartite tricarboxylate transporter substrate binding protein n=1 Tax=Humitalea sp. 24SJ18S-53 TaxID=3422307 RepID=UPI003D66AF59
MSILSRRDAARLSLSAAATALLPAAAGAQGTFPDRPITFVVPYGAGGPFDLIARVVAERMRQDLGRPVVVENRAGAGGIIGCASVARAPADGYTILLGGLTTHILMQGAVETLPFDPIGDFAVASLLSKTPLILAANKDLPVTDLASLVALLKASPGRYTFASAGNGTSGHVVTQYLVDAVGAEALHVPYRTSAQATTDLLTGRIDFMVKTTAEAEPMRNGSIRPLVIFSDTRAPALPDVPTLAETGFNNVVRYNLEPWQAIMVRRGTPDAIVARLNQAVAATAADPATRRRFEESNLVPFAGSVADGEAYFVAENTRWVPIVRGMGLIGR